ncbi:hypothetical protein K3148_13255 [Qipengyuania aurantiaca]|uniref:Uncharacterized protein n=1 Tax=Qipengyuania aurantiaca TaxID=2867233 RepID=A0ABX8ZNP3_9SPHN|nr:hypothetical protein [Qipengyuania aurantiaca]QZD89749.1 hypothetical protein K3148_13255 [Qipengyuania aurantiaca]
MINYLPVVSFDDWVCIDGFDIIRDRLRKDTDGKLASALKTLHVSEEMVQAIGLPELIRNLARDDKVKKKQIQNLEKIGELSTLLDGDFGSRRDKKRLFRENPKFTKSITAELVKNSLSGYYFIPNFSEQEGGPGYVILLREPSSMPFGLACRIARGLSLDDAKGDLEAAHHIAFQSNDFAMPVRKIASPHIEHLLQTFSLLYGRIGLPDLPENITRLPEQHLLEA